VEFNFTKGQVQSILKTSDSDEWYEIMDKILPKYDIDTPLRVAAFIAQCAHESMNFTVLSENLNYSAEGLNKTFAKYFVRAGRDARPYHRQPEKIANLVYANRMSNGPTESGDGWKFRGGGVIQLTGRYNITNFGKSVGMTPEQATTYIRTKQGAIESACWFWDTNNLNRYCDSMDIKGLTKAINGGYNGLEDRVNYYNKALKVFNYEKPVRPDDNFHKEVRIGSKGDTVRAIQKALGIRADGDFGPATASALRRWQSANKMPANGVACSAVLDKLLG